jgi:tight adherence protein B
LSDQQKVILLLLAISTFVLVLSIWVGGILLWSARRSVRSQKVQSRLGIAKQHVGERTLHLWLDGRDVTMTVPSMIRQAGFLTRLTYQFHQAGWILSREQILVLLGGIVIITTAFFFVITQNLLLGLGVSVGLLIVFRIVLLSRVAKREALFETQLLDALELAARSLRAGHPLLGAFQLVSEEMQQPIRTVFLDICQRHGMGANLEEVLQDAGDQTTNDDMKLFATSVAIQLRTGGNLADLMERLALVIRDRMRLHRRVRVLTAQTQMSKRVLLGLPFIMFIMLNILNADYMSKFYTEFAGKVMLAAAVFLLAFGAWVMNRMAALKY